MSDKPYNIVLLVSSYLTAAGVSAESLKNTLFESPGVSEVRVVPIPAAEAVGPVKPGARLFWVGPEEIPGGLETESGRQYTVGPAALKWLAGSAEANIQALLRSVLDRASMDPDIRVELVENTRSVLVQGQGPAADRTVSALTGYGLPVVRVCSAEEESTGGIELMAGFELEAVEGFAGRFTAVLNNNGLKTGVRAGAVIICGNETRKNALTECSRLAVNLSAFDREMDTLPPWADDPAYRVAFVVGRGPDLSTRQMRGIMECALKTAAGAKAGVYVFAPHVKVADNGLEALYGRAREAGVVFVRTPDAGPGMEMDPEGQVTLKAFDPVARAELKLRPDVLVMDEPLELDNDLIDLADKLALKTGPDGYPAPDNVLFLPSQTNRRGIFVLGPARGTDAEGSLSAEIQAAVAEAVVIIETSEVETARVVFNEELCAHCLSCVRICPMGAIKFTNHPTPDHQACIACGLCVARCPAKALTLIEYSDDQSLAGLQPLLSRPRDKNDFTPRLVMFGCQRSAARAMKSAPSPDVPVDLIFMPLPCGGRLEDAVVIRSFLAGADGVMVMACHQDNCRSGDGTGEAEKAVGRIKNTLALTAGLEDRLSFFRTAPNAGCDFTGMVTEFSTKIKNMGPWGLQAE